MEGTEKKLDKSDVLSFKRTGRSIDISDLSEEFSLMRQHLEKDLTPEIASRVCEKSGTHLIKLVSPRVDGEHSVLRVTDSGSNRSPRLIPSVNAPDIPFCKVLFRPLEIHGHEAMSIIAHIQNPIDISETVLNRFADVFGQDVLEAIIACLFTPAKQPEKLGAGEFPIIFIPRPGGGDLQITPVSPAATFMGMKHVAGPYFQKSQKEKTNLARGKWSMQSISSKPQNISGAIGGGRRRFLATLPKVLNQNEAELYRYSQGGSFPRWRDEDVGGWILRYADMLSRDAEYNNKDTRSALDRTADRLIRDAISFIQETLDNVKKYSLEMNIAFPDDPPIPSVLQVLIRRSWKNTNDYERARKALTSPHFHQKSSEIKITTEK